MTKNEKLKDKLRRGGINANELRTLLKQEDWLLDRVKGSHEIWCKEADTFVLATHSKDLKSYQIKQARLVLLTENNDDSEKEN